MSVREPIIKTYVNISTCLAKMPCLGFSFEGRVVKKNREGKYLPLIVGWVYDSNKSAIA